MLRNFFHKKSQAQAVLEYIVLIIFIAGAFVVFRKYIARAIAGRWKTVGDSLGSGMIYDPNKSVECARYNDSANPIWYDRRCAEANCPRCYTRINAAQCLACLQLQCQNPACND
jgi:hypothetical protein